MRCDHGHAPDSRRSLSLDATIAAFKFSAVIFLVAISPLSSSETHHSSSQIECLLGSQLVLNDADAEGRPVKSVRPGTNGEILFDVGPQGTLTLLNDREMNIAYKAKIAVPDLAPSVDPSNSSSVKTVLNATKRVTAVQDSHRISSLSAGLDPISLEKLNESLRQSKIMSTHVVAKLTQTFKWSGDDCQRDQLIREVVTGSNSKIFEVLFDRELCHRIAIAVNPSELKDISQCAGPIAAILSAITQRGLELQKQALTLSLPPPFSSNTVKEAKSQIPPVRLDMSQVFGAMSSCGFISGVPGIRPLESPPPYGENRDLPKTKSRTTF